MKTEHMSKNELAMWREDLERDSNRSDYADYLRMVELSRFRHQLPGKICAILIETVISERYDDDSRAIY